MTDYEDYCQKWDAYYDPASREWRENQCGATTKDECAYRCWDRPKKHSAKCPCLKVAK